MFVDVTELCVRFLSMYMFRAEPLFDVEEFLSVRTSPHIEESNVRPSFVTRMLRKKSVFTIYE